MISAVGCHSGQMRNGAAFLMLTLLLVCGTTLSLAAGSKPAEIPDTLEQRLMACEPFFGRLAISPQP